MNNISIISAPEADADQIINLTYAIEQSGGLKSPVYVTKADIKSVSKEDILDWFETLAKISIEQGWGNEVSERLKGITT